ncbi:MAG: dihydrofolate synthase / folylpolyglutamate synthase [Bryobacterales bacterium]|jgi:dihydrofolate synthase/folylpolyglutamate synthase|nr:dihydrofolate synthase / folylpolyglutamate synthase [Bryobacterales bacterium]
MTFADTVRFLFSLGPELKTVKWDLDRIARLLEEIGNPQRGLHTTPRYIHVAGTNGKGSTCAMVASALRVAGYRTGLYTSPHLQSPVERIQVNGQPLGESEWVSAFEQVHAAAESLLARDLIEAHPSFFETVTAMAFLAFARASVEVVVLEVGLGGRLDATNVIEPEIAVITPIDFDHEAFLGSGIESIAAEKAGILKRGRPAVFASQRPEALKILEHRALELDVPVRHSSFWRIEDLHGHKFGSKFILTADEEIPIDCPLAGLHQVENARTAVTALSLFGVPSAAIQQGIARAVWPGRLERVATNPDIILDGAHNPAGAAALAAYIREFFKDEPLRIIYGAMRDKAVEEVTNTLFPLAQEVILTAPDQPRALSPESLAPMIEHPALRIAANTEEALRMAREHPMTTFVTGSLFLVGEARGLMHANFRAEVACYTAADPYPTIQNLSNLTGIPVEQLIRYILVKYAASASDALLAMDPIVFRQMREQIARAEEEGTDAARLRAFDALSKIIRWLALV